MIFVTGDMHGDIKKLKTAFKGLKKGDTLLIAGDFGFIWKGNKAEEKTLKKIGKSKFDVCFVDGANENHDLLMKYPMEEYHGGEAAVISGNLRWLRRGSVFEIESKKIFAFGGAKSDDIESKQKCGTWHAEELPNEVDFEFGRKNLEKTAGRSITFLRTSPRQRCLPQWRPDLSTVTPCRFISTRSGKRRSTPFGFSGGCTVTARLRIKAPPCSRTSSH